MTGGRTVLDTIRIHNMSFYGYHGVDASERDLGGNFYKAVYELVAQIQGGHSFRLLEALAHAVAEGILQHFDVSQVTVRIRKAAVPLGGLIDYAEVEVTRPVV